MSSFNGSEFSVMVDSEGYWPAVERDAEGVPRYKAEVLVSGVTVWRALLDLVSVGTLKRVNASNTFNWHSNNGVGAKALIVPDYRGTAKTYAKAVLVSISGRTPAHYPGSSQLFRANLEFIILSDPT